MARYAIADLYNTAKLFFLEETARYCSPADFMTDSARQYLTLYCIHEFCQKDMFFKVVGDKPIPMPTPPGIADFLTFLANALTPAQLDDRIRSDVMVARMMYWKYAKYWEFPEVFFQAPPGLD